MDIKKIIEQNIKFQVELGNDKFAIYPAGKIGLITKEILNGKFDIRELALVDNYIESDEIISLSELLNKDEWFVILLTTNNKKVKSLIIETLKGKHVPIVDVLAGSGDKESIWDNVFDFCNPPMKIDDVDEKQLQYLFERTVKQWKELGESEPFWSVLTQSQYRSDRIGGQEINAFFESGQWDCNAIEKTLIRNRLIKDKNDTKNLDITELGCGCGRVTKALCNSFKTVYAYDISPGNIEIAKKYINSNNVIYKRIESIDDYEHLVKSDVVYSMIVLQHNVPPVIRHILRNVLFSLKTGGTGIFQIPSYKKGYSFSFDVSMNENESMDMHVLPQNEIFEVIKECECDVLECYMDLKTGVNSGIVSSTYVVRKN